MSISPSTRESSLDVRLAKALAHPTRIEVLERLKYKPASPVETYGDIGLSLPNVSYHFKVLFELGMIEQEDNEVVRGALKTRYRSCVEMLFTEETWVKLAQATKHTITKAGLNSLVEKIGEAIGGKTFDNRPDRHLAIVTLLLDEHAWSEIAEDMDRLLEKLYRASHESSARVGDRDARFPVSFAQLLFESPADSIH